MHFIGVTKQLCIYRADDVSYLKLLPDSIPTVVIV